MALEVSANPVPLCVDVDGVARVGNTRVTLETLVEAFGDGATAEEIVQQYPSLRLADVYSVIGFYLDHQSAVEEYLTAQLQRAAMVRQENEARSNPNGVRERLLARRQAKKGD